VNDENDSFLPAMCTKVFSEQMRYIVSNFNVLSLEDIVERMKKKDIPDNSIVITFDDGYKDNYLNVFPILKELSIPATIFLATEVIGSQKILWHDRVFSAFRETQVEHFDGFGINNQIYSLTTQEEKNCARSDILKFLKNVNNEERILYIDRLMNKLDINDKKEEANLMMTWEEVKKMHENGIFFGAHTVTHTILSNLNIKKAEEEIFSSKKIIEEKLGTEVRTFAYPNGSKTDFNETTKNLLREAGYSCAVTTMFGTNSMEQDCFELRRGMPWEEDIRTFGLKLHYYRFCS
jgi:peptidoglycan/xylan/chitin deacetylase (PgdA/CDA1 family)